MAEEPELKQKTIVNNRKAFADYEIVERFEAGIALLGTEVKSIRAGRISIKESHVRDEGGELYLIGANITEFDHSSVVNHAPLRKRKLLLHRREIDRIAAKMAEKGLTCVPLSVHLSGSRVKLEIALARGRKKYDKREAIKKKDNKRDLDRQLKEMHRKR